MPPETIGLDMPRLIERVHAAARLADPKTISFRRLATRSRREFNPKNGWMIPLRYGDDDVYAVELVPCEPGDPGAVAIHRHHDPQQCRVDAQVLYDLWAEEEEQRASGAEE